MMMLFARSISFKLLVSCLILSVSFLSALETNSKRPNIIFIFTDDLGYGDLRCYGHPYAQTPNLDRLAEQGTKFMNFHVTDNICPGSRAGFMTSRSPATFPNYSEDYGFLGAKTITELLSAAGYKTGQFGKWNIGRPGWGSEGMNYGIDEYNNAASLRPGPYRSRDAPIYDDAINFIERHHNNEETTAQPFYLNIWNHVPHTPIRPPPKVLEEFPQFTVDRTLFGQHQQQSFDRILQYGGDITWSMRNYLSEIKALDTEIGRLLDFLDKHDLTQNTIVAFSSDNGPTYIDTPGEVLDIGYAGGLRGGKHTYFEGGIKVPFIVRWPGHVPSGRVNANSVISALDWLPTLCSLANVPYDPSMYEGEDVSDIWRGESCRSRKNPLFWRAPYFTDSPNRVMKHGNWKYHLQSKALYNVDIDPGEFNNVASQNPHIVEAMKNTLARWSATLPADVSTWKNSVPRRPFDPNKSPVVIGPPANVDVSDRSHDCHNDEHSSPTPPPLPSTRPISFPTFPPTSPPTSSPTLVSCELEAGSGILLNEYLECGSRKFGLSSNGNVVFMDNGKIEWDANIRGATRLNMQLGDGNLVAYTSTGRALWASDSDRTGGRIRNKIPRSFLKIKGTSAMVVSSSGIATWQVSYVRSPTQLPTLQPSSSPTEKPTFVPTGQPTLSPTARPTGPTPVPTLLDCEIKAGSGLVVNEYIVCGRRKFGLSADGNVVSLQDDKVLWNAGITGASVLYMQFRDGNLVAYGPRNEALWASNSDLSGKVRECIPNSSFRIDEDTGVVKSADGVVTWQIWFTQSPTDAPTTSPTLIPTSAPSRRPTARPTGPTASPTLFECELQAGSGLVANEFLDCGRRKFGLSSDGNIVFLEDNTLRWDAGIRGATRLEMQRGDGNLVAYNRANAGLWSSNSDPTGRVRNVIPKSSLKIDGPEAVVISPTGAVTWKVSYTQSPTESPSVRPSFSPSTMPSISSSPSSQPSAPVSSAPTPLPTSFDCELKSGYGLVTNQYLVCGRRKFGLSNDGNIVFLQDDVVMWHAGIRGAASLIMQRGDGNLVAYSGSKKGLWSSWSDTTGRIRNMIPKSSLRIDGSRIVIESQNGVLTWEITSTQSPTQRPSDAPSLRPTKRPTSYPSLSPSDNPTVAPSLRPTDGPTLRPTDQPTNSPVTAGPTFSPTLFDCELKAGSGLARNEYLFCGRYKFGLSSEGDIVFMKDSLIILWNAGIRGATLLFMQRGDGNLVARNGRNAAVWSSRSDPTGRVRNVIPNSTVKVDGEKAVVVSSNGVVTWAVP